MSFFIDVAELCWINGQADDAHDLCLHGQARVCIAGRLLEYEAAVSASALYLLKTLSQDHHPGGEIQLLPCCGHFILPDEAGESVTIVGCGNGIDWTVRHQGEEVVLELAEGVGERLPFAEYRRQVFRFADKIEDFYKACSAKIFADESEAIAYAAFWREWRRRRGRRA